MNESSRSGVPRANYSAVRRTMSSPHSQTSGKSTLNVTRNSQTQPEDMSGPSSSSNQYTVTSQSRAIRPEMSSAVLSLNAAESFVQSKDDGCHWFLVSGAQEYTSAQLVSRRSKHTMVKYKNALYVFGGDDGRRMLNDLVKYDIEADQWLPLRVQGANPSPRYHHSAVVYKHSMFVFGGYSGGAGNSTTNTGGGPSSFDLQQNSTNLHNRNDLHEYRFIDQSWHAWIFEGGAPTPRSAHCSFVYKKKLWIFGGYGSNRMPHDQRRLQNLNDMWNVSLETTGYPKKWQCVEQSGIIPPPCCNFSVTLVDNRLFLFSGVSGKEMTNHIFTFNLDTYSWTRISPEHILHGSAAPPQKRYGHTMVEYHGRLYVFGGSVASAHDNLASDLLCFDLDHKSWEKVIPRSTSQPITGRLFHTAVVYQDKMYIFGGTVDFDKRSNELFAFKFPTFPKCTLTEDLLRLLTDTRLLRLADVCFTFPDGAKLQAHAVIVAARCAPLKEKIIEARKDWKSRIDRGDSDCPSLPEVHITETNKNAFHLVLQYLYTDRIRPDFTSASSRDELLLQIIKVCKLAAVYSLVRLECLCLRFLEETICMENILTVLHEAYSMNLTTLREYCVKKVVREDNFTALIQKETFAALDSQIIVDLIRRHKQVQCVAPSSPQISWASIGGTANTSENNNAAHSPNSTAPTASSSNNQSLNMHENLEDGTLAVDLFNLLLSGSYNGRNQSDVSGRPEAQSEIARNLESLNEFADVQLAFGDDLVISAHRAVLAARSQYFLSLFDFNSASSNLNRPDLSVADSSSPVSEIAITPLDLSCPIRVTIDDIVPTRQALHTFLRYVYSGHTLMPPEDSLFLLRTPSYYGLTNDRLAHICQRNLETNITTATVIKVYITVDSIPQFSEFKDRCLNFIVDHFIELGQSEDKELLSQSQLCEIWEMMSLSSHHVYNPYP